MARRSIDGCVKLDPVLARAHVFITGDTVSPDTRRFLEDVDNPCLAKPFRVREVRETIAKVAGGVGRLYLAPGTGTRTARRGRT